MAARKKPELSPPVYRMELYEDEFQWVADIIKAKKLSAKWRDYDRSFPKSWDLYCRLEAVVAHTQEQTAEFQAAEQARIDEEWENRPYRRKKKS